VEIVAPLNAKVSEIREKIIKRSAWIMRQRRHFLTMHAERPERRYCTGATHCFLGRQYRLKVSVADKPMLHLRGAYIHIGAKSVSASVVSGLFSRWLRARAREQFEHRLKAWRTWCVKQALPAPKLHLLDMPKRWGSTHSDGSMFLNPELVRAPTSCIDYVIMHEVCHLKHPRHDRRFYAELGELCPRWKAIKQRLETSEL
jgi:hypothetical protein